MMYLFAFGPTRDMYLRPSLVLMISTPSTPRILTFGNAFRTHFAPTATPLFLSTGSRPILILGDAIRRLKNGWRSATAQQTKQRFLLTKAGPPLSSTLGTKRTGISGTGATYAMPLRPFIPAFCKPCRSQSKIPVMTLLRMRFTTALVRTGFHAIAPGRTSCHCTGIKASSRTSGRTRLTSSGALENGS